MGTFTLPSAALDLYLILIYSMHSHSLQAAVMKLLWLFGVGVGLVSEFITWIVSFG